MINKLKKHWRSIMACVACALIFFFAGMALGKIGGVPNSSGRTGSFSGGMPTGTPSRTQRGGGFASGQVTAKDNQSITLQLPNGNSEIVLYSSSTQIVKPTATSLKDVTIGGQVMIGGTQNSDGSLTAQSIQIRGNETSSAAIIPPRGK